MKIELTSPVGEIAVHLREAIPYFEDMKIDYCCGGKRPLRDACELAGVPVERVLSSIQKIMADGTRTPEEAVDWRDKSMGELIDHIVEKHHAFTRSQLDRLTTLSAKVTRAHGTRHTELFQLENLLRDMASEMEGHLAMEEDVVFSYLKLMEKIRSGGKKAPNPFAVLPQNNHPLSILAWEHDMTGDEWNEIHRLTRNFTTPAEACESWKELYRALRVLEKDIHQHVHLENNILFPKAIKMGILD